MGRYKMNGRLTLPMTCIFLCLLPVAHAFAGISRSFRFLRIETNPISIAIPMSSSRRLLSASNANSENTGHLETLKIVFSDVDGALVHYIDGGKTPASDRQILSLPPSATGMKGIISAQTLKSFRGLREKGVIVVLVSGMRTSTLLNRLPYLPRADAYCTEAGGRIFYPTEPFLEDESLSTEDQHQWTPVAYEGASPEDLIPFGLTEDKKWRSQLELEEAAGTDGYAGNEIFSNRICDEDDDDEECLIDYDNPYGFPKQQDVIPLTERKGALWEFARQLQHEFNFVLDTKSYSTCFRVNRKHQSTASSGEDIFQALLDGDIVHPPQLGKSTNLGCIDIYPVASGKRNCCQFIADSLNINMAKESVCICDDDNDIEMALSCAHAYIPALTSESMLECIQNHPDKLTQTVKPGLVEETLATEAALQLIDDCV